MKLAILEIITGLLLNNIGNYYMKTLSAVLEQLNTPLKIHKLTLPGLKPGQVLVKVAYSGICHSQLLEIQGKRGDDKYLPHTLGHEGSGIVLEIGDNVKKVKPGDHVVLSWIKGTGMDVPSTTYQSPEGPINSGAISTFMYHTITCENRLTPIPDTMPLREAALLGCAIPTGAGIVLNAIQNPLNSSIAIFGIGGIGLSALLAAKMIGTTVIIAIDVLDQKLEHAIRLGATHTINAKKQNVLSNIMKITNNHGVDYAIESAGKKDSMETAFQSVCDNGGLCIIAGNLPHGEKISINPFDLIKGKQIVGTWGGETQPDNDIPMYIDFFLSNKLNLKKMIGQTYKLEEINNAFNALEKGSEGRILINMTE